MCNTDEEGNLKISIEIAQGEGWEELESEMGSIPLSIHKDKGSGAFFFNGDELPWNSDAEHPEVATAVMELKLPKCPSGKQEESADIWLYADQETGYDDTDIVQVFKLSWSYECCGGGCCGGCCTLKSFDANVQRTGNDPGGNLPMPGSETGSDSGSESN